MIYSDIDLLKLGLLSIHSNGKEGKFEDWDIQRKEAYYRDVGIMLEALKIAEHLDCHPSSGIEAVAAEFMHDTKRFFT